MTGQSFTFLSLLNTLLREVDGCSAKLKAVRHALIVVVCGILGISPVEEDSLADHRVAHDRDMAQHNLLVNCNLLVVIHVTDLDFEDSDDSSHHDGQNLVLKQILHVFKARRRVHSHYVPHNLQVLGSYIGDNPTSGRAQLCNLPEDLIETDIVERLIEVAWARC